MLYFERMDGCSGVAELSSYYPWTSFPSIQMVNILCSYCSWPGILELFCLTGSSFAFFALDLIFSLASTLSGLFCNLSLLFFSLTVLKVSG